METIVKINEVVNGIVWGVPIMLLILGTGIYYTIRFGFIQFRHPVWLVKQTIVKAFQKKDEGPTAPGELTSFQAAMTSVSAIVGSGNIAGAATAIVMGGPGALIWMIWLHLLEWPLNLLRLHWVLSIVKFMKMERSVVVQCTICQRGCIRNGLECCFQS